MAIASSAAESPSKSNNTNPLEKRMMEEVNKNMMDVDDPHLGNLGSGVPKQPDQIHSGAPLADDQASCAKNGKTCHQCRQKTLQFAAACKNIKKNKQCVIKLCCKCLFNRYGEKAEEVAILDDWKCPKCRGICNCSFCMRKRGYQPTGTLVHTAKASGFSSVSEMFNVKGTDILTKLISPEKLSASDEFRFTSPSWLMPLDRVVALPLKHLKENHFDQAFDAALEHMEMDDAEKDEEEKGVEIILPNGTELTSVAEVDLPAEDVGNALQFIEFCCTFGEIFDIKKGQADSILYDIMTGRSRPGKTSSLIQFQIQLLMLIMDLGEELHFRSPLSPIDGKRCWLHILKVCISESEWVPKELASLDLETNDQYYKLGFSEKLSLLVFLCDETLETMRLRTWLEEQNLKFLEEKKVARGKLAVAKEKEKLLKKQLHDEVVKATIAQNGASLSISEHNATVSELKAESERVHAEILETTALLPRYERQPDALRTEPVLIDTKGRVFWRLKGCNKEDLLLQDISSGDEGKLNEKWFSFDHLELEVVNEHISSHRGKRLKRCKSSVPAPAPAPAPEQELELAPATNTEDIRMNPYINLNEIPESSCLDADDGFC